MVQQKKIRKTSKKFLSPTPHEYGSVAWEVCCDPKDSYDLIEASLRIGDCSKNIELGFDAQDKKHLKYRLAKLDTLIKSLQEMRAMMTSTEVQKIVDEKVKIKEAREKARKAKARTNPQNDYEDDD